MQQIDGINELRLNNEMRTIVFVSSYRVFGTTGGKYQSFGETCYRLGPVIVAAKTFDRECRLNDGSITFSDLTRINYEGLILKKPRLSFRNDEFMMICQMCEYLHEMWKGHFDKSIDFDDSKFFSTVKDIKLDSFEIDQNLVLDSDWSRRVVEVEKFPLKGIGTLDFKEPEYMTFSDYVKIYEGSADVKTAIHVPMLIVERGYEDYPFSNSDETPEAKLALRINDLEIDTSRTYEDLEIDSFLNNGSKQSLMKDQPDIVIANDLNTEDLRRLANRGVFGKTNHKLKEEKEKRLSWDANTTMIEDYLSSPINFDSLIDEKDDYLLSKSLTESTKFIEKHIKGLCKSEFYEPLRFLDAVMSEVMINAKRNPKNSREFIIRPILGYKAFVIIRNTRLGSVNNPSPSFYSIIFKGKQYGPPLLFEEAIEIGAGWSHTRFLSTDRTRSSHLMNVWEQFLSIIWENSECLASLTEVFNEDIISSISVAIKYDLLALLNDSTEYSAAISNLRFYYFPLLSGFRGCKTDSEKMIKKFPTTIRNPLLLYTLKKLMELHSAISEHELIRDSRHLTPRKMMELVIRNRDENVGLSSDYGAEDLESDSLPLIMTPFGFNITNTRSFLKASFKQIYHNKDESDKGPAAKQIVSKIFKTEKRMREALESKIPLVIESEKLDGNVDIYQFNLNAIVHGADLVKIDLINEAGLSIKNELLKDDKLYSIWMREKIILPCIKRTTYSELATSKSSFINSGDISIKRVLEDDHRVDDLQLGRTKKCIEVLHEFLKSNDVESHGPAGDLEYLLDRFEENDGGRIVVKIFKKDQNTGVRDIYILTILGRMLIRICEDISRSICRILTNEKLTSPWSKDRFMTEHYTKVKDYLRENKLDSDKDLISYTFKESGDMSEWANRWFMKSISVTLLRLVPEEFHKLIMYSLNAVTNKHIELPRQFVKSCFDNPDTVLINEMAETIKRELLSQTGTENKYVTEEGTRVSCLANMMQGILHYTSSLAHTSSLRLFCKLMTESIERLKGGSVHVVMSYECSSDDKGVLMTMISKRDKMPDLELVKKLWRAISRKVDRSFGIKTSDEKTNLTATSLFEFNNVFYCGNSISTALAKFTTRCLDDSIQSSLHQRVSGFYSSLRQVRENGGSGILCSLLSYAQRSVLINNLGWRSMEWFDDEVLNMLLKYSFSYLGVRAVSTPITAGICMAEYENMKESYDKGTYSQLVSLSKNEFSDEELIIRDSMDFGIWERDKHKNLLRRLGLEVSSEITEDDLRISITGGRTKSEMQDYIVRTLTSKSFGRSLAMVQRSDLIRAGVYLLWSQTFIMDGERVSIYQVVKNLDEMEKVEGNYPDEYKKWFLLEKSKRVYSMRQTRSRLRPRKYDPLINVSVTRDEVVMVLKKEWYDEQIEETEEYSRIKDCVFELDWLKKTPAETFSVLSPKNFLVLLNGVPNKFNKMRLLARGPSHSGDTIEVLMRENCCADMIMSLRDIDETSEYLHDIKITNSLSHRIHGWSELLHERSLWEMSEGCMEDIRRHSEKLILEQPLFSGTFEDNKLSVIMHGIKTRCLDLKLLFNLNRRQDMFIKHKMKSRSGDLYGESAILKYWRGAHIVIYKEDEDIIRISSESYEVAEELSKLTNCKDFDNDFPSLIIDPVRIRCLNGTLIACGKYFETCGFYGTSRIGAPNIFERDGGILDDFLRSDTPFIDVRRLNEDNCRSEAVSESIWRYHLNVVRARLKSSSDPDRPFFPKRRFEVDDENNQEILEGGFDLDAILNSIPDADQQEPDDPMDFGMYGDMGFMGIAEIPDWTIAGTETAKLRENTGWERNEAIRELVEILRRMERTRNWSMFSDHLTNYYNRMADYY
jgi:hypothetical protein